jgi:hypothetical protein
MAACTPLALYFTPQFRGSLAVGKHIFSANSELRSLRSGGFAVKKEISYLLLFIFASLAFPLALAQSADKEGCKDFPLFNRMPNYHISDCDSIEFDARQFPVGPPLEEQKPKHVEAEGAFTYLQYGLNEGAKAASGLQIMRNFENATKAAGGTVEGKYADWCKAYADYDSRLGNSCTYWGLTMKFVAADKEI